jgi:hypothetical protein
MYYSFRNPETGKLVRQPNIKAGVNTLKNFQDRIKELKNLKKALVLILDRGYNPFKEDTFEIIENRLNNSIAKKQPTPQPKEPKEPKQKVGYTIIEAKEIVLITKKKVLSH